MQGGRCAWVSAPPHLHIGNIDLEGGLGRWYGTAGITVSHPRLVARVCEGGGVRVRAVRDEGLSGVAREYAGRLVEAYELPGLWVELLSQPPFMAGMGSRSTLAMALIAGAREVYGVGIGYAEAFTLLRGGFLTGLGYYGFQWGGFLLDAGVESPTGSPRPPPLVSRVELPGDWRVVVVLPREPLPRVLELKRREEEILANLHPMPREAAEANARHVLMKLLPAALEADLRGFVEALHALNRGLGDYWSRWQRGPYCCRLVEEGVELLARRSGGAAQSSWGPTFYTIAPEASAHRLAAEAREWLQGRGGGRVWVTSIDNQGARVEARW